MNSDVSVTKYIYAYKNKVAGVYYVPFVLDDDPELCVKKLIRSTQIDHEASKNLRHLELWLLGCMEDSVGFLVPDKKYLLDLDEALAAVEAKKEDKDGK